jgi:hypothetical protein
MKRDFTIALQHHEPGQLSRIATDYGLDDKEGHEFESR